MNNSMFRFYCRLAMAVTCFIAVAYSESRKTSGNPVFPGWLSSITDIRLELQTVMTVRYV